VTIVVNQRPVEEGYMPGQGLTGYEFELVEIPGKSQSAWLGSKPFGDRRLWNLEWVDENQVLVQVTGPVDGRELVLEVAYSLE
jgi:hypothetical protein